MSKKKTLIDHQHFTVSKHHLLNYYPIIKLLSKSAFDPHYCLLCVDLFSSKIYSYPMIKSLLVKKMEHFYEEIETKKRDSSEQMRIQTDLKFRQREI